MKKFARIRNGVVENISEAESVEFSFGGVELDPVTDATIGVGDLYDGSVFSKRAKTQEQIDAEAHVAAEAQIKANARADLVIQYLATHTPAECEAYVAANVNNLTEAKNMLGKFAIALCVLSRREFR